MVAEIQIRPLASGRLNRRVHREEQINALLDIRRQAGRVRYAVVADRPDVAMHAAGNIVSLAERRLRQITGDFDDAA
jgi:hypothetical protein